MWQEPQLLLHLAGRLARAMDDQMSKFLYDYSMTQAECAVLTALPRDGKQPMVSELATQCGVQQPTASKAIHALHKRGFLQRHDHSRDQRVTLISLTTLGRDVADTLHARCRAAELVVLAEMRQRGDLMRFAALAEDAEAQSRRSQAA